MKKHPLSRLAAALVALCCLLPCLLVSCSRKTTVLTWRDGAYRSEDGKTAFLEAPVTYYALSALTDSSPVTIRRSGVSNVPLYTIEGAPLSRYLADENLMLYYAEGTELPTLADLGATKIVLYQYSDTRVTRQLMATLTNREQVDDLVRRASAGGDRISADRVTAELYHRMELLFINEDAPAFGIMLEYRKFSVDVEGQGKNFLYDRVSKTYIPVGDVLESYFIGDGETGTAADS